MGKRMKLRTVGNVTEKQCQQCGKWKPYTERYYPPSVASRDWLDYRCRACRKLNSLLLKLFGTCSKAKLEAQGVNWREYYERNV